MKDMLRVFLLASALAGIQPWANAATDPATQSIDALRQDGYSIKTITPIFGQLLITAFPPGFAALHR